MAEISSFRGAMARLLVLIGAGIAAPAIANPAQPWPDVLLNVPIADGFVGSGEVIGRIADDARSSQLETRIQLGHTIGKHIVAWAGWVHFANYNPHARNSTEDQAVEQVNWNMGTIGRVRLLTRTRLEERTFDNLSGTSWRWRQQVRFQLPLSGKRGPVAVAWGEPFLALNHSTAQFHTLDQLRLFAGFMIPVSRHLDLEIGYLNQRIYRANTTIVNDAIPMMLTVHL